MSAATLYIGDLSRDVVMDDLYPLFKKYGCSSIIIKRSQDRPFEYGFVNFPNVGSAESALKDQRFFIANGKQCRAILADPSKISQS